MLEDFPLDDEFDGVSIAVQLERAFEARRMDLVGMALHPDQPLGQLVQPLAGAKILQREAMSQLHEQHGLRTVRICYPAMPTTALGAIPGGMMMYAVTAQILKERGEYQSIEKLAEATMALWREPLPEGELRLDAAYQRTLPEFHVRKDALTPADLPQSFSALLADQD